MVGERGGPAFLCKNGETLDLGTLPGDRASRAHGINASAQVIGEISATGLYKGRTRAFSWRPQESPVLAHLHDPPMSADSRIG